MLVGAHARRQNLRDVRVRDNGEAVVDGAGRRRVFVGRDFAQREHEGEDTVLVVLQVGAKVTGLDAAKGKGRAVRKAEGINQGRHVPPKRNQPGVPAKLHALFGELFGELFAVRAAAHENVKVLLLELLGNLDGDRIRRRGAGDGGKSGGRAIDKLNAALAHDDIVRSAQPDAVHGAWAYEVFAGLDDLAGEQGRHPGVQCVAEVGQPYLFRRAGRQQLFGPLENPPQISQRLHLLARKRVDHR